jgi:hypothetical protein
MAGNAAQGQRRRAPAARRCIPHAHVQDPWILFGRLGSHTPSRLKGRSTVDPCAGCTARSTAHVRVRDCWIQDPRCGFGDFDKEPQGFHGLACRSFHLIRILRIGPELSHPILQGKPNASHVCARIILHTHDRQNECNTIAVINRS